ncbi:hypothetical protein EYF80_046284 [Liparis tanakae]|uniref:Uncharacterized protein n=1 Tax=Liparis tanakae TaxID=230148 RepID=A0A4Z2FRP7_9TELE|nr:hypothetical protein EYF80_046284 [Liparis tanakae]
MKRKGMEGELVLLPMQRNKVHHEAVRHERHMLSSGSETCWIWALPSGGTLGSSDSDEEFNEIEHPALREHD